MPSLSENRRMRQLQESDSIKSLGDTPLGDEFPEGAKAEVTNVETAPSAGGGQRYTYSFRTTTGIEFQITHKDLERAVSTEVVEVDN